MARPVRPATRRGTASPAHGPDKARDDPRSRADEALRESEARLQQAQALAHLGHWRLYPATREVTGSDELFRIFGLGQGEATLEAFAEVVHPDDREFDLLHIRRGMEHGEPWDIEHRLLLRDGTEKVVHAKGEAVTDDAGEVQLLVGTVQDITERKRAEEALRESEERHRLLFENASLAIGYFDPDGNVIAFNAIAARNMGGSPEDFSGKPVADLFDQKTGDVYKSRITSATKSQANQAYEDRVDLPAGSQWFLSTFTRILDAEGAVVGVQIISADITERKQAEEERRSLEAQVRHAQKLESLGVLAGGVAHDFNNLLVGMLGHSDLALNKLSPENPARSNIEQVKQAAQRAADLSRQMLAYSGHGHFIVKATDLSALVRENVHLLEAGVAKGVELRTTLSEVPTVIEADVGQMQQVIMNLAMNGAEAIGDRSGHVTILTGFETLSGEESPYSRFSATELSAGRYVFLEVRDDGSGMDADTLSKVFDPFFTTKFVGRGLGLSALLGIVRGHKGGIDVESEPGKGTTFRLVFPVAEEAPEATKAVAVEGSLEGTILVIDDEEIVRSMADEMLTPEGMTVLTAEDGAAGVALYEKRRADIGLVLLDYSMPEMGGEETFKELRQIDPDVPVLLSSGFGQEEATRRFEGLGLTGFIQKPYSLAMLLAEVRRCLGTA